MTLTRRESRDLDNYITGRYGENQFKGADDGPWRLYVYDANGQYGRAPWFRRGVMQYPDEEISLHIAEALANRAIKAKLEVRVTDAGDELVFRAVNGEVVYGADFWAEVGR